MNNITFFSQEKVDLLIADALQMETNQLENFANELLKNVKTRREEEQKKQVTKHLAALHNHINALQKMNYNILFDTDDGTLRIWYDNKDFVASVEEAETENKAW